MPNPKVIGPFTDSGLPEKFLRFCAISAGATEESPLKLGNVEFWIGAGPFLGIVIYSIPSYQWDREAVKDAMVSYLSGKESALEDFLYSA